VKSAFCLFSESLNRHFICMLCLLKFDGREEEGKQNEFFHFAKA